MCMCMLSCFNKPNYIFQIRFNDGWHHRDRPHNDCPPRVEKEKLLRLLEGVSRMLQKLRQCVLPWGERLELFRSNTLGKSDINVNKAATWHFFFLSTFISKDEGRKL